MNGRSHIYLDTSALLNKIAHISQSLGADSFTFHSGFAQVLLKKNVKYDKVDFIPR